MIALALLLAAAAPTALPQVHRTTVPSSMKVRAHARKRHRTTRLASALRLNVHCAYSALGGCARPRSPYRLADNAVLEPDGKAEALSITGARCAIIGQTICPRHPRKIVDVTY
jgi:hypothetical protein